MSMHTYRRYEAAGVDSAAGGAGARREQLSGVICAPQCNIVSLGRQCVLSGALQEVCLWNLRRAEPASARRCRPNPVSAAASGYRESVARAYVTQIDAVGGGATGQERAWIAAGYSDGTVRVFQTTPATTAATAGGGGDEMWEAPEEKVVLRGHRAAVTALHFVREGAGGRGMLLVSGSADTTVIVWDLVAETGVVRLRGHRGAVTAVVVLDTRNSEAGPPTGEDGDEQAQAQEQEQEQEEDSGQHTRGRGGDRSSVDAMGFIVSAGKDMLLKVWDMQTQHCVQTVVGHRAEIWHMAVDPKQTRVVTGSSDNQLRCFKVLPRAAATAVATQSSKTDDSDDAGADLHLLEYIGSVQREFSGHDRTVQVSFDSTGRYLASFGAGKVGEIFRVRDAKEIKKRTKRRQKRRKTKEKAREQKQRDAEGTAAQDGGGSDDEEENGDAADENDDHDTAGSGLSSALHAASHAIAQDELEMWCVVRLPAKARSFCFLPGIGRDGSVRIVIGSVNNSLHRYGVPGARAAAAAAASGTVRGAGDRDVDVDADGDGSGAVVEASSMGDRGVVPLATKISVVDMHGHRGDVRAVALSNTDTLVASAGSNTVKIWNCDTLRCVRTASTGFGLCVAFGPGDRHLIVGTREGTVQVVETSTARVVEEHEDAHDGAVWSVHVRPDMRAMVTGGADHLVKFWSFGVENGQLTLEHERTLKMSHDVLCVRYSPHRDPSKVLLAVALLDNSVRIFFDDSLKFFLSLYGHSLPVMAMDVSRDGTMLVTASADRTAKVWGLDFGDCHVSFRAHADSVVSASFVGNTHYFFTASKDGLIKYWDADRQVHIITLAGHVGEVWGLSCASDGSFLMSTGSDRSLRVWERTEDQVFLEEEREREMEQLFEGEIESRDKGAEKERIEEVVAGAPDAREADLATRRSIESVRAGERLIEALDTAEGERKAVEELSKDRQRAHVAAGGDPEDAVEPVRRANPHMLNLTPERYILYILRTIKAPELEQALLVLPFHYVPVLCRYLLLLLRHNAEVEVCVRCVVFLLRVHHAQIVTNQALLDTLHELRDRVRSTVKQHRDGLGSNLAALRFLKRSLDEERTIEMAEQTMHTAPLTGPGRAPSVSSGSSSNNKKRRTKRR